MLSIKNSAAIRRPSKPSPRQARAQTAAIGDQIEVLSTEQAARLIGVSRHFLLQKIVAGDIPVYRKAGVQRRLLKADVLAWHEREQVKAREAFKKLAAELDDEIFSNH